MKHDAQIEIIEKINKAGQTYKIMQIWVNGLMIHEVYIKDSLNQIIEYVIDQQQKH
jgi:hypothetical protein